MIFPLTAANAILQFDIFVNGEKRYEIVKNVEETLTMSAGKLSTIDLVLDKNNVIDTSIELTASKTTIYANGSDYAEFTVMSGDSNITDDSIIYINGKEIAGNKFTTEDVGTHTCYAMYDGVKSNEVNITARVEIVEDEKPLELKASADVIKANGVDAVTFSIRQDGADVAAQSTIYVNGGVLNGSKFSTTTPGTYTVYAEKGEVKSNEITITAEEVTATGKSIVFADGVTMTSGWYDVNKVGQGDNGDINMCWAATSSNMIQWFQDRYVAAGKTLPATAVTGPGKDGTYELALMDMYHSEWDNSRGGHMQEAIPWYFEGVLNGGEYASEGSQAKPLTAGGYWKDIWATEVYPNIYHGYENIIVPGVIEYKNIYTTVYNNYYTWGNGTSYEGTERLKIFSDLVVEAFEHGMASLTVNLNATLSSASHAVTLWGYEIDNATGLVTRLWITDSDDLISEPKAQLLNAYNVSIAEGKSHIKLTGDTRYGACYIVSIHPFSGYGTGYQNNQ